MNARKKIGSELIRHGRIPHRYSVFIRWIEFVSVAQDGPDIRHDFFGTVGIVDLEDHITQFGYPEDRGKGTGRNENSVFVPLSIRGVLVFFDHDAHHRKRYIADIHDLSDRVFVTK